jgi:hypothetical protein
MSSVPSPNVNGKNYINLEFPQELRSSLNLTKEDVRGSTTDSTYKLVRLPDLKAFKCIISMVKNFLQVFSFPGKKIKT